VSGATGAKKSPHLLPLRRHLWEVGVWVRCSVPSFVYTSRSCIQLVACSVASLIWHGNGAYELPGDFYWGSSIDEGEPLASPLHHRANECAATIP
jgi:hypothetical protein